MSVSLEQIDMLKERANISYAEAKEALEKCNNDIVEALIALEKENKVKAYKVEKVESESKYWTAAKKLLKATGKLIKKGNETKFVVKKAEKTVVDLPVNAVVLTTVIAPPIAVLGVAGALVTNHKIKFIKPDGEDASINKTIDKISKAVTNVGNQVAETINS
ncbi:DUF4342 domain-containing protein [Thermincola potens]|uniref:Ubiquitin-associated-domain-containing protein n=1 Tax=Thermincola potens (strain JR) TaxID=635013 RepID=D5XC68_THEPJ|nr:DUF4342 domain-containing protein [Thermincola potens]ADG83520.1 ubiquitin-associated- domain-containing protein [Thermincola potens JR]